MYIRYPHRFRAGEVIVPSEIQVHVDAVTDVLNGGLDDSNFARARQSDQINRLQLANPGVCVPVAFHISGSTTGGTDGLTHILAENVWYPIYEIFLGAFDTARAVLKGMSIRVSPEAFDTVGDSLDFRVVSGGNIGVDGFINGVGDPVMTRSFESRVNEGDDVGTARYVFPSNTRYIPLRDSVTNDPVVLNNVALTVQMNNGQGASTGVLLTSLEIYGVLWIIYQHCNSTGDL